MVIIDIFYTFIIHLSLRAVVSSPLHGVLVGSRHHSANILVDRIHHGCRVHGFSRLQLPLEAVV